MEEHGEGVIDKTFPDLKELENKLGMKTPESLVRWMSAGVRGEWCPETGALGRTEEGSGSGSGSTTAGGGLTDQIRHLRLEMGSLRAADVSILLRLASVHEGVEALRWLLEERPAARPLSPGDESLSGSQGSLEEGPGSGESQEEGPGTGESQEEGPGTGESQEEGPGTGESHLGEGPGSGESQEEEGPGSGESQEEGPVSGKSPGPTAPTGLDDPEHNLASDSDLVSPGRYRGALARGRPSRSVADAESARRLSRRRASGGGGGDVSSSPQSQRAAGASDGEPSRRRCSDAVPPPQGCEAGRAQAGGTTVAATAEEAGSGARLGGGGGAPLGLPEDGLGGEEAAGERRSPPGSGVLLGYDAQWRWVETQDDVTFL